MIDLDWILYKKFDFSGLLVANKMKIKPLTVAEFLIIYTAY